MAASVSADDSQINYHAIQFFNGRQKHKASDTGFGLLFIKRFSFFERLDLFNKILQASIYFRFSRLLPIMFKVAHNPEHEHGRSFFTLLYFGLLFFSLLARTRYFYYV